MVLVKSASGLTTIKPSSTAEDVDIAFTLTSITKGIFTGKTPTNTITDNLYSIGTDHSLKIKNLAMTKTGETSWGLEFVDNICTSFQYNYETPERLIIKAADKTLLFEKL
ncbi:MAG: hypothetical protein JWN76_2481 [Chitinophagaceae bacterium]|nr:hypothetical protein [Chitinophagaceae bacterium]